MTRSDWPWRFIISVVAVGVPAVIAAALIGSILVAAILGLTAAVVGAVVGANWEERR